MALTPADFDLEKGEIRINKNYQKINGVDIIQTPRTPKSNRTVTIPDTLVSCLREYMNTCYNLQPNDRIFPFTKCTLNREIKKGCQKYGVKKSECTIFTTAMPVCLLKWDDLPC
ncbi:hypothetical protein K110096F8_16160 [Dielma fastidiosa]